MLIKVVLALIHQFKWIFT